MSAKEFSDSVLSCYLPCMVADRGFLELTTAPTIAGVSATRYFLTVFLLIPKFLAIPGVDTPSSLARCIAYDGVVDVGGAYLFPVKSLVLIANARKSAESILL